MKFAFLDRDGTMIWEPPDTKQIDSLDRLKILPGVIDGLHVLKKNGFELVMVSNQNGIGSLTFPREAFEAPQAEFVRLLAKEGIEFYAIFVCPHFPDAGCNCRKPKTGLVDEFLRTEPVDILPSIMVGDRDTDREFAKNIGVQFVGMQTNGAFPTIGIQ